MRGGLALLAAASAIGLGGPVAADTPPDTPVVEDAAPSARPHLPLLFEANVGQTDESVTHLVRARGYIAYFTPEETVLALRSGGPVPDHDPADDTGYLIDVVRMRFAGGATSCDTVAEEPLESRSHYFLGDDPDRWVQDVPHFRTLAVHDVYPGIDVRWRTGDAARLTYDLCVAPGADPALVAMRFDGAESVALSDAGELEVRTPHGLLTQSKPALFQTYDGERVPVGGAFDVGDDGTVRFDVESYDRTLELVIDPGLSYSTYFGTSEIERGYDMDFDSGGNVWIGGYTASTAFPTTSAYQSTSGGAQDGFVAKFNASGTALLYATYLGGTAADYADQMEIGPDDSVYVAGHTYSTDFPTSNAYQSTAGSSGDGIVVKLNSSGSSLVYSTYLGGTGVDWALGLTVDSSSAVYVNGYTASTDFPTTSAAQGTYGGGVNDGFVTKLTPGGTSLAYSTYVGGSGDDCGWGRHRQLNGVVYLVGWTTSSDYPTTTGAMQTSNGGGTSDAVVTAVSASGSSWVYSTYVGGSGEDRGVNIDVDSNGNAFIVGHTASTDFPTTSSSYQPQYGGGARDAFVAKLNPTGTALVYATYVGGSGEEFVAGGNTAQSDVKVDASGNAYVVGFTGSSSDFPLVSPFQPTYGGGTDDAFVLRLNATGTALHYSSYLGGGGSERPYRVYPRSDGSAYVVGWTTSSDFPTASPLYSSNAGSEEAFIVEVAAPTVPETPADLAATSTTDLSITVTWTDAAEFDDGYEVERAVEGGAFSSLAQLAANSESVTDGNVVGETEYSYRVRAVNPIGASEWATVTLMSAPHAPTDAACQALSNTQVSVSWTDSSATETSFRVERRAAGATDFAPAGLAVADATTFVDTAATPETTYTYRVRAEGTDGASRWAETASITMPPRDPRAGTPVHSGGGAVTISWTDGSDLETGFEVQRGIGCPGQDFVTVRMLPTNSTSFVDSTVAPETTYSYRVRAVNAAGASEWSAEMCITTPPRPPADVVATPLSPSRVVVRWTDSSAAEDSYVVRRAEQPGGTFSTVATLPANTTEFEDRSAGPDTRYVYGVRATDDNGQSAEVQSAEATTPSALVVSKAQIARPKAKKKGGSKPATLSIAGTFDLGARSLHLGGRTVFSIGDASFTITSLNSKGKGFRYENQELRLDVKPIGGSVGRVSFKARLVGARVEALEPDAELIISYERDTFRAAGAVEMVEDRFDPAAGYGRPVDPRFGIASIAASLRSGPKDSLTIRGTFDASAGLPARASELIIQIGLLNFRAPGDQFVEKKGKLFFKQSIVGSRKVTLDYAKGTFTAVLKGVELGEYEKGELPLVLDIAFGDIHYRSTLQVTSSGKSLRY